MMETLRSTSGFTSEASLSGHPQTPPYTPACARAPKRRLERSYSPASTAGSSKHPAENTSPAKKAAKRVVPDEIKVEELLEGDVGYMTDLDVVYPGELEEISSSGSDDNDSTASDVSDVEATGLTKRFIRLRCVDDRDVEFAQLRHRIHMDKRTGGRMYKRSHSQSVKSEVEATDPDARADHDVRSSQRRQRRRVRGPEESGLAFEEILRSSPEVGTKSGGGDSHVEEAASNSGQPDEAMDIDDQR